MLRLIRLEPLPKTREDAASFAAFQQDVAGFHTPVETLERDAVHVARDASGTIVGGLVVGTEPPFRTLDATVEPADRETVAGRLDLATTVELHGVMLRPHLRGGFASSSFWFGAMRRVQRTGKKTLLGSTTEPALSRLYARAGGRLIYTGTIQYRGETRPTFVYTWEIERIVLVFIKGALLRSLFQ